MLAPEDLRNVDRTRAGGYMHASTGGRSSGSCRALARDGQRQLESQGSRGLPAGARGILCQEAEGTTGECARYSRRQKKRIATVRLAAVGRLPETGVQVSFVVQCPGRRRRQTRGRAWTSVGPTHPSPISSSPPVSGVTLGLEEERKQRDGIGNKLGGLGEPKAAPFVCDYLSGCCRFGVTVDLELQGQHQLDGANSGL
jgi:hypothetical protein